MWSNHPAKTVSATPVTRPLAAMGAMGATRLSPPAVIQCEEARFIAALRLIT